MYRFIKKFVNIHASNNVSGRSIIIYNCGILPIKTIASHRTVPNHTSNRSEVYDNFYIVIVK